ncbi:MAG: asparagine synthase-related protein, partial [Terriglobales bacterium]
YWLAHDLRPLVDDLLSESQIRRRGLFRPEVVRSYVDEHRRGAEDWSMQIWQFLTLEIWMQLFLDGGSRAFAAKTYARKMSGDLKSAPRLSAQASAAATLQPISA